MARKKRGQERPLHELYPPVTLKPMGAASSQENQGNLLAAKQVPEFPMVGGLLAHAISTRADRIMLDYTQAAVAVRYEVDGVWMNVEPRDRPSGDAMLVVMKKIASLNPQDRRSRQEGKFGAVFRSKEYLCRIATQGVKTGERVLIKIATRKPVFETLDELGMRPAMRERFKELIDEPKGFVIISTPPGEGLSTLWRIALTTSDRYVRDFVAIEDKKQPEEEVVNISPVYYDSAEGQKTADVLPRLFLKMPDVFVVPELGDGRAVEMLCDQVNSQNKLVIARVPAKEASDALLRVMAYKGPVREFAQALKLVLSCRLVRKLCESCRQSYQPSPQLLQKLGIPPGRVPVLYRDFQPPPPEQRVDAKGRPIDIPICEQCGGIGFFGRTGIFEMMVVNDMIREAIVKHPNLEAIRRAARMSGHRTMQEEGIVLVARGTTSLQELQRVLKQ